MRQEGHCLARTLGVAAVVAVSTGAAALSATAACGRTDPIVDAATDASPDAGRSCLFDLDCQNDLACDGTEACGPDLLCAPGAPPACDDAVLCTDDACEEPGGCTHVPNHGNCPPGSLCLAALGCTVVPCTGAADCQDAFFCNGSELCEKGNCTVGAEPTCQDFIDCTADVCDEAADTCAHVPVDAACDDGLWCNGFERCLPPLGCGPGPLPPCGDGNDCTDDSCDEALAACVNTPVDHDGDGFAPDPCGADCNDDNADIRPSAVETCTGDLDDDCDALADCADLDCAGDPACAPAPSCLPSALLDCGGADARANAGDGATSVLADYSCGPLGRTAPETIYEFTPASDGVATFTLAGLTADLDLFVLAAGPDGACDPALCLFAAAAAGPASEMISLAVTAGAGYHVVVDGPPASFSFYDLGVACGPSGAEACDDDVDNDLDGAVDCLDGDCASVAPCAATACVPAAAADCTTVVVAANNAAPGATDLVGAYGGACGATGETGPEFAYAFTAAATGFAAAFIDGLTADLDLFVLAAGPAPGAACDPDACIASGTGPGPSEGAVFAVAAGETYYVVVDGALGATSDYDLWMFCSAM